MIDHDHFVLKTKGFLTYENQKRGSEWYQVDNVIFIKLFFQIIYARDLYSHNLQLTPLNNEFD